MKLPRLSSVAYLLLYIGQQCAAQNYSNPVGAIHVSVPAQSDAILGQPFDAPAIFTGTISSRSENVVTVSGNPSWTSSQFAHSPPSQLRTYGVQICSGAKQGLMATITANTTDSLTLQLEPGDTLDGMATDQDDSLADNDGDTFRIVPLWSASTILQGNIPTGTELFIFDNTSAGVNSSPSLLLQYFSGYGWFETVSYTDQSHRPFKFGTGYILRNNSNQSLSLYTAGVSPQVSHRSLLRTISPGQAQDQLVSYHCPVPDALGLLGLGANSYDELYLFDNNAFGKNKSPASLLMHFAGKWYDSVSFTDVTDAIVIPGLA